MRLRALLPLVALFASCHRSSSDPAPASPAAPAPSGSTPTPAASSSGPAGYQGPVQATLGSDQATVVLRLVPFGMQIQDPAGNVVLDTQDTDPLVPGDAAGAYGALGITHHATTIKPALLIEGWDHTSGSDNPWSHLTQVTAATMDATSASVDLTDSPTTGLSVHVDIKVTGAEVKVDAKVTQPPVSAPPNADGDDGPPGLNQMGVSFVLPPDEHFFGLGERYVTVDHRGQRYECWTEEGGLGAGETRKPSDTPPKNPSPNGPSMTHLPVPFLLSTRGYGLWLETTFRTGFSLGKDSDQVFRFYAAEPALHYHVLVHQDPKDTLAHYTQLTGRAHLPAAWVFGPRRRVDHGSMVAGLPEEQALRAQKVPTTMVDDTTHFLPIGAEVGKEPFLTDWCKQMHAMGYKTIGYYNAYVSVDNPAAADLLSVGRAKGYFVKLADGTEFDTFMISAGGQQVATIDFSNPDAAAWYGTILQRALDIGYDGWMLDFGEYLPQGAVLADGRTGWEAHNAYPLLYQKATFDYLTSVKGDDFMFYARAGYAGSQAHAPVIWSGDPSASFDDVKGLPANVRAGINAGISGIPYWGSDISGYTCLNDPPADKEVYLRWAEFGAFSPDMHDENACSQAPPGAPPKWTLWSDAETTQVYGTYARLHTRLIPYLYAAAKEAADTGMPILRHPVLLHPSEPGAVAAEFDYYFGPSLYVAPVVRRGDTTRTLWLPPGAWVDFWTLAPVQGGAQVTRAAPLGTIPLYQRSGSIVALLDPSVETLAPTTSAAVVSADKVAGMLDLRAAIDPGAPAAHAALTDGTTLDLALAPGAPALPAGVAKAKSEADLSTCSLCGQIDALAGGGVRLRVTGASVTDETLAAGSVTLSHHAPAALRARWDVVVVPMPTP